MLQNFQMTVRVTRGSNLSLIDAGAIRERVEAGVATMSSERLDFGEEF